jgi:hypothetical protein
VPCKTRVPPPPTQLASKMRRAHNNFGRHRDCDLHKVLPSSWVISTKSSRRQSGAAMCSSADLMRQDVHHQHDKALININKSIPQEMAAPAERGEKAGPPNTPFYRAVTRFDRHDDLRSTTQSTMELREMKPTWAARCVRIGMKILVPLVLSRYRTHGGECTNRTASCPTSL